MADQMTPAELRETAKRLRRQKLIPRNEGSPMDHDLRAGADALDRLADAQTTIDDHMRKIAHRVMDVFENAEEDTLADEIMQDVFTAIGLTEAFGAEVRDVS